MPDIMEPHWRKPRCLDYFLELVTYVFGLVEIAIIPAEYIKKDTIGISFGSGSNDSSYVRVHKLTPKRKHQ